MKKCLLASICACGLIVASINMAIARPMAPNKAERDFIHVMVKKHHFNQTKLKQLFQKTEYIAKVLPSIKHPIEKKLWDFYRRFFLKPERIKLGVRYWHQHAHVLKQVAKRYGVDPSVIVAIIGVETLYGKHQGTYPELSTLATLAFHYPPRQRFFTAELKEYLLLTRQQKLPPLSLRGSYAGALGIPQFMPSSYRAFAVDYSRNHHIDLLKDHDDAIASVANYLHKAGWKRHQPVATLALIRKQAPTFLVSNKAKLTTSLKRLKHFGVRTQKHYRYNYRAALIVMQKTDAKEYWVTFRNFKAIMAYNPRTTYALAVYQLSQAIEQQYEKSRHQRV